eukprot:GHRQ01022264.1.p2 GENE.GHRQ01022264.1~~GHRQ01022264.1.p2  ORF type:complete len:120 (+),score=38.09 GHRQ01022264.1:942-1301(+)
MSSSEGWLIQDKLRFPDNGSSIDFVFGCEDKETGAIYKQQVDGVLGMGNNENSFPRQLARAGLVDNVFSLCYGFPAGGAMLLGESAHLALACQRPGCTASHREAFSQPQPCSTALAAGP